VCLLLQDLVQSCVCLLLQDLQSCLHVRLLLLQYLIQSCRGRIVTSLSVLVRFLTGMNRKAGRAEAAEDAGCSAPADTSDQSDKNGAWVLGRDARRVRCGMAAGTAAGMLTMLGLGIRWQPALLLCLCLGCCVALAVTVRLRVLSRKAMFMLAASTLLVVCALLEMTRPFLPSLALLWRRAGATVYNTMPCHFKEAALYFDHTYWQMLRRGEAWRSCVVPLSLFDSVDRGLRRPDSHELRLARAHAVRKLKNSKLREWLERRSLKDHQFSEPPRPPEPEHDPRSNVTCPLSADQPKNLKSGAEVGSYVDRGTERCMAMTGVWCCSNLCEGFCKIVSVATLLVYRQGDVVFDWGAGCGHMLGWLERTFGVIGTSFQKYSIP
jgi:hypothetical protein